MKLKWWQRLMERWFKVHFHVWSEEYYTSSIFFKDKMLVSPIRFKECTRPGCEAWIKTYQYPR